MRTSLEIPDSLFKEAKRFALETDTTLKNLVAEGLELVLKEKKRKAPAVKPDSSRLPKVGPEGAGTYSITCEEVKKILLEEEMSSYGRFI